MEKRCFLRRQKFSQVHQVVNEGKVGKSETVLHYEFITARERERKRKKTCQHLTDLGFGSVHYTSDVILGDDEAKAKENTYVLIRCSLYSAKSLSDSFFNLINLSCPSRS